MCFDKEKECFDNMSFLTVVKAKDISSSLKGSGLVGLSPSPAKDVDLKEPLTHGVPSFIA